MPPSIGTIAAPATLGSFQIVRPQSEHAGCPCGPGRRSGRSWLWVSTNLVKLSRWIRITQFTALLECIEPDDSNRAPSTPSEEEEMVLCTESDAATDDINRSSIRGRGSSRELRYPDFTVVFDHNNYHSWRLWRVEWGNRFAPDVELQPGVLDYPFDCDSVSKSQ